MADYISKYTGAQIESKLDGLVVGNAAQGFTETQKATARANIGAQAEFTSSNPLAVDKGGTGQNSSSRIRTNLSYNDGAYNSPFGGSQQIHVTGTLPIANGGTGATDAADARSNLGLGSAAVANLDTTLSIAGAAANAKATGERIADLDAVTLEQMTFPLFMTFYHYAYTDNGTLNSDTKYANAGQLTDNITFAFNSSDYEYQVKWFDSNNVLLRSTGWISGTTRTFITKYAGCAWYTINVHKAANTAFTDGQILTLRGKLADPRESIMPHINTDFRALFSYSTSFDDTLNRNRSWPPNSSTMASTGGFACTNKLYITTPCKVVMTNQNFKFRFTTYDASDNVTYSSGFTYDGVMVVPLCHHFTITFFFVDTSKTTITETEVESIRTALSIWTMYPRKPVGAAGSINYFNVQTHVNYQPYTNEGAATSAYITPVMATQQAVIALPNNYTVDGDPCPLIMFCHGKGGDVVNNTWYAGNNEEKAAALISYFQAAGYAVFDVGRTRDENGNDNSNDGRDWGCPQLMDAYHKAYDYIQNNYNVEKQYFVYGFSYGSFSLMNEIIARTALVKAVIWLAGRQSMRTCWAEYSLPDATWQHINSKFGISGTGYNATGMQGFDHYEDIVTEGGVSKLPKQFPPMKVFIGSSDMTGVMATAAIAMWQAIRNAGNIVSYHQIPGYNHDNTCFLYAENDNYLKAEAVDWFNRWR